MERLATYFRRLQKLLRHQGQTRQDAEDLIQEAFLRMQAYCEEGGEVREPEAFLVRTVQRLSVNARRNAHHDLYVDESPDNLGVIDLGPTPEELLAADECLQSMTRTLNAVSHRTREVFFLHRLDGLSYAQIAQQLGISVSAIEKHIARAAAALTEEVMRS
jgi:RNA polymerase sigma factor (sigma-70 family)